MAEILVSNLMMIKERDRFDTLLKDAGHTPIWPDVTQYLNAPDCLKFAGKIDGWLAGDDQIDRHVCQAMSPRLKVISKWGTGIDSIDLAAAREAGIPVCNSPGAFADAVGECAIGYLLMLARNLNAVDREVRAGGWPKPQGISLRARRIGIVGFGAIGRRIGELAQGFGMEVSFSDPMIANDIELPNGTAQALPLGELAASSDAMVLACALTPENHHMINARLLSLMPRGALFVNVARGPLVDETALLKALNTGQIAGAALDVFEVEPLPEPSPLRDLDQVILGSHNSNNAFDAVEYVHKNTLQNLFTHLN